MGLEQLNSRLGETRGTLDKSPRRASTKACTFRTHNARRSRYEKGGRAGVARVRPSKPVPQLQLLFRRDRNVIEPQEAGVLPEPEFHCGGITARHHVMAGLCIREWLCIRGVADGSSGPNHLE